MERVLPLQLSEFMCPSMTKAADPLMRKQILKVEAEEFGSSLQANKRGKIQAAGKSS